MHYTHTHRHYNGSLGLGLEIQGLGLGLGLDKKSLIYKTGSIERKFQGAKVPPMVLFHL